MTQKGVPMPFEKSVVVPLNADETSWLAFPMRSASMSSAWPSRSSGRNCGPWWASPTGGNRVGEAGYLEQLIAFTGRTPASPSIPSSAPSAN